MCSGEVAWLNLITYKMAINLNMFGTLVEDGICRYMHGCHVITIKLHWLSKLYTKVTE